MKIFLIRTPLHRSEADPRGEWRRSHPPSVAWTDNRDRVWTEAIKGSRNSTHLRPPSRIPFRRSTSPSSPASSYIYSI